MLVRALTDLSPDEVNDVVVKFFARDGWSVHYSSEEVLVMTRRPGGCLRAALLVLTFPFSLLYLLSDRDRHTLTVDVLSHDDGQTEVEFYSKDGSTRRDMEYLAAWMEGKVD